MCKVATIYIIQKYASSKWLPTGFVKKSGKICTDNENDNMPETQIMDEQGALALALG
jgi:hypothetical protein